MAERVKIVVVGPKASGKSAICTFISKLKESFIGEYRPTISLRICEFERENLQFIKEQKHTTKGTSKAFVELWDVSGDTKFQHCWPAIIKDAQGVLFVYNSGTTTLLLIFPGQEKELEFWYNTFAAQQKMKPSCCMIFLHSKNSTMSTAPPMPKGMESIKVVETSLDIARQKVNEEFDALVESIVITRRETDENTLLQK